MRAIAAACADGSLDAEVAVVIASRADAPALESAREMGLDVAVVPPSDTYANDLLGTLQAVDIVCLAGYLRLLPGEVISAFPRRVLNIHPALLPKYGGKGMYG